MDTAADPAGPPPDATPGNIKAAGYPVRVLRPDVDAKFQDRLSSARWQRDFAEDVIDGRDVIVAEFFDVGESRQVPWPRRPQAARLLATLADPGRGFDAVVVGEFERAFYGNQFRDLAPLFNLYSVQLWLSELNGPVDASNEFHLSLLTLLGVHSKREVQRSRFRAKPRDARPGGRARPSSRWPTALRLPAGRRGPTPEPGARQMGTHGAPAGT
ncbi:hypothetical protein O7606_02505 [Micromonospora sp. WMMD882]|uniref:hypothetical protein n=1 Tax=Micromonospora sp. WMMD882 TaxID=3015151 RepID=UPI00248C3120|nr:hypothetical protein [Micromonospora sp. WMMD882]WBB80269.1 hypothetical protein O7606_02505 [Micromonospora sp. WMMD882]